MAKINQLRDVAGRLLSEGDVVAVTMLGSPSLKVTRIHSFTKCKIRVPAEHQWGKELRLDSKFPYQVVLVNDGTM